MRLDDVIKGMDCCLHMLNDDGDAHCDECPYNDKILNRLESNNLYCIRDYVRDARRELAKYREMRVENAPRVVTLQEADDMELVWVQRCGDTKNAWPRRIGLCWGGNKAQVSVARFGHPPEYIRLEEFSEGFRCWSARPTEKMMEETPWS